jgi:hypothetical protein
VVYGIGRVVPVLIMPVPCHEDISLYLMKHHPVKTYLGVKVWLHDAFLTSAIDGGEWSASCPSHFTPEKIPWYSLDGKLGGSPELIWMWWQSEKFPTLLEILNPIAQPIM